MWWKLGVWRLKVVKRKNSHGICSVCRKEEESSQMLRCQGTKIWRDQILKKDFRNVYTEIGIMKLVGYTHKEQFHKMWVCMI
jgi:hypothetical protein